MAKEKNFNSSAGRKGIQDKLNKVNQELSDLPPKFADEVEIVKNVIRSSSKKKNLLRLKAKYEALIAKADELGIEMPPEE